MSKLKVKILATPKENNAERINPFEVPQEIATAQAKYGGLLPDGRSPGTNDYRNGPAGSRRIDTKWDYLRGNDQLYGYAPSPYSKVGKNLPKPLLKTQISMQRRMRKSWEILMEMVCLYS